MKSGLPFASVKSNCHHVDKGRLEVRTLPIITACVICVVIDALATGYTSVCYVFGNLLKYHWWRIAPPTGGISDCIFYTKGIFLGLNLVLSTCLFVNRVAAALCRNCRHIKKIYSIIKRETKRTCSLFYYRGRCGPETVTKIKNN